jgi:hypothetical protein
MNFEDLLKKKVKPPIMFKGDLNEEGFEERDKFELFSTSLLEDETEAGVAYNGFTYFKPDNQSFTITKEEGGKPAENGKTSSKTTIHLERN